MSRAECPVHELFHHTVYYNNKLIYRTFHSSKALQRYTKAQTVKILTLDQRRDRAQHIADLSSALDDRKSFSELLELSAVIYLN